MEALIQAALSAGAAKAALIEADQVVYSESFRKICEANQCGCYGSCWVCPPEIGETGDLIRQAKAYPRGLLYQTIGTLEDSFDVEGMFAAGANHAQVSVRLQKALPLLLGQPFLHLGCGGCHLCETCAKRTDEPCRHPEYALPAMEGYCIDVYNTTRTTPLHYINGTNTVTYFGLVLFTE
jgi:predicted metal-binding protein